MNDKSSEGKWVRRFNGLQYWLTYKGMRGWRWDVFFGFPSGIAGLGVVVHWDVDDAGAEINLLTLRLAVHRTKHPKHEVDNEYFI